MTENLSNLALYFLLHIIWSVASAIPLLLKLWSYTSLLLRPANKALKDRNTVLAASAWHVNSHSKLGLCHRMQSTPFWIWRGVLLPCWWLEYNTRCCRSTNLAMSWITQKQSKAPAPMCSTSCSKKIMLKKRWPGVELEEAKAGFPRAEGSRDPIAEEPINHTVQWIWRNSGVWMRFHQAFSTVANLGASTCFALANAKRFLFEEEAKMARDFGDFDGMRRTQISRGACGSPFVSVSMRPRPEESEADCRCPRLHRTG